MLCLIYKSQLKPPIYDSSNDGKVTFKLISYRYPLTVVGCFMFIVNMTSALSRVFFNQYSIPNIQQQWTLALCRICKYFLKNHFCFVIFSSSLHMWGVMVTAAGNVSGVSMLIRCLDVSSLGTLTGKFFTNNILEDQSNKRSFK